MSAPVKRIGCRGRICTCHDDHAWAYPGSYPNGCSACGCRRETDHEHGIGAFYDDPARVEKGD